MNLELRQHRLAPLITVTVAAMVFAILLILVRLQWAPLESADHGAAADINRLVAGHATLVRVVKAVTWLGSNGVLWAVIAAAPVMLAIRRRWRLAAYLLVTGAGALILDPILKSLVGRLRPVVAHPIAYGTGDSFPSGHSLGSPPVFRALADRDGTADQTQCRRSARRELDEAEEAGANPFADVVQAVGVRGPDDAGMARHPFRVARTTAVRERNKSLYLPERAVVSLPTQADRRQVRPAHPASSTAARARSG
jgi:hypothetical protein